MRAVLKLNSIKVCPLLDMNGLELLVDVVELSFDGVAYGFGCGNGADGNEHDENHVLAQSLAALIQNGFHSVTPSIRLVFDADSPCSSFKKRATRLGWN
jgi:hypothetical protein